jgi:hypothetical protein
MKLIVALCSLCLFYAAEAKAANFHVDSRIERPSITHHVAIPNLHFVPVPEIEFRATRAVFSKPDFFQSEKATKALRLHTGLSPPERS